MVGDLEDEVAASSRPGRVLVVSLQAANRGQRAGSLSNEAQGPGGVEVKTERVCERSKRAVDERGGMKAREEMQAVGRDSSNVGGRR